MSHSFGFLFWRCRYYCLRFVFVLSDFLAAKYNTVFSKTKLWFEALKRHEALFVWMSLLILDTVIVSLSIVYVQFAVFCAQEDLSSRTRCTWRWWLEERSRFLTTGRMTALPSARTSCPSRGPLHTVRSPHYTDPANADHVV